MQVNTLAIAGVVAASLLLGFFAGSLVDRRPINPPGGGQIVFATTTITCGKTTWRVSTGTSGGACDMERVGTGIEAKDERTECKDGENSAGAKCNVNGGEGGCTVVTGAGSCTKVP